MVHVTYPEFAPRTGLPVIATGWHPYTSPIRRILTARRRWEKPRVEAMFALSDAIAIRRATAVAAVSRTVEMALRSAGVVAEWIPPCVPDELINPVSPIRSRDCVLIARWLDHPRKGLPLAVEAVRRVRERVGDARLILVGGFLKPQSEDSLPDYCVKRGILRADQIRQLLSNAGCCLVPSVFEEFGYAALEALAAGTPVVSTPLPGFEGLETDGFVCVPERDPAAFSAAILRSLRLESFVFPTDARASTAGTRLIALYESVLN